jgi:integral membrane sensor domain MASE1
MGAGYIPVVFIAALSSLMVIIWAFRGAGSLLRRRAFALIFFILLSISIASLAFLTPESSIWLQDSAFLFFIFMVLAGFAWPHVFSSNKQGAQAD